MQAKVRDRDEIEYIVSFEGGSVYIGISDILPRIPAHYRIHEMMSGFLVPTHSDKDLAIGDYVVMGFGYARSANDDEILDHIKSYKREEDT